MNKIFDLSHIKFILLPIILGALLLCCEKIITKQDKQMIADWDIMTITKGLFYGGDMMVESLEIYCVEEGSLSFYKNKKGFFNAECNPFNFSGEFEWDVLDDTLTLKFNDEQIAMQKKFKFNDHPDYLDLVTSLTFNKNFNLLDTVYYFYLTKNVIK